jgi:hypothetical protein
VTHARTNGAALIAAERLRQVGVEGHDDQHDDEHYAGELSTAAITYAVHAWWQLTDPATGWTPNQVEEIELEQWWPWDAGDFKPSADPIRNLERAGALIAAEIDRLLRAETAR